MDRDVPQNIGLLNAAKFPRDLHLSQVFGKSLTQEQRRKGA